MPYLKSICVHSTVRQCLRYILNPDKTEDLLFTSSLNCLCDADEAYLAMKMIYEHYSGKSYEAPVLQAGKNSVKAIHYIQSFKPDEDITPEKAHQIAKAFAKKTFGDDVQVVIATHTDKEHIHSHLLINSYSVTGRKYYSNKKSVEHAREYSDRVCAVFGIQPIKRKDKHTKNMKYNEWDNKRKGTSWKQQIRSEIDSIIPSVKDIEELYAELQKRGYTVRRGNTPAIKADGQERFVRLKTLGDEYTEQSLTSRILWNDDMGDNLLHHDIPEPSDIQRVYISAIERLHILITEGKKIQRPLNDNLPYLPNNDRDVQIVSAQLAVINRDNIQSIGELESRMEHLKTDYEGAIKEINALTAGNSKLEGIISQAKQYFSLCDKPDRSAADDLRLNISKQTVTAHGILTRADLDRLKKEKAEQDTKIAALKKTFESCKKKYEMYREIAVTYHDIAEGDYISKLIVAEKEKHKAEQEKKDEQIKKKNKPRL